MKQKHELLGECYIQLQHLYSWSNFEESACNAKIKYPNESGSTRRLPTGLDSASTCCSCWSSCRALPLLAWALAQPLLILCHCQGCCPLLSALCCFCLHEQQARYLLPRASRDCWDLKAEAWQWSLFQCDVKDLPAETTFDKITSQRRSNHT